jgi:hypothetical protein
MADPSLLVQAIDSRIGRCIGFASILERPVREVVALQVPPARFDVVEFGCITRHHSTLIRLRTASAAVLAFEV